MNDKEIKKPKNLRSVLIRAILFLASLIIMVYFLPREGKFRYHFNEGKPWKYGLLTAPFDFPIYKNESDLAREKDSVMQNFQPYYNYNKQRGAQQVASLKMDYTKNSYKKLSRKGLNYLEETLRKSYNDGIMTADDYKHLQNENFRNIRVMEDNVSKTRPLGTVKTIRQVYEYIIENAPDEEIKKGLRGIGINNYIEQNLVPDTLTSSKVKNDLLQTVSLSSGMVQLGERIVDRGEIITPHTYRILRSLEIANSKRAATVRQQSSTLIGQTLFVAIMLMAIYLFLYFFRPEMYHRHGDIEVIILMVTFIVVLSSFLSGFRVLSIYMAPVVMVPIVIRTVLDSRVAFFSFIITVMICSFMAPFAFEYFLLQITAGIAAIFTLKELSQRSQMIKTAAIVMAVYSIIYVCYTLIIEGSWSKINVTMFVYLGISSLLLLTAYLLIFVLERIFGFVSSVTLIELSNINAPLLRRLSEEAPGTFQHSMQVSNLCAQAARKINANVQLVRTAALYHDIGKINNPSFFTENQIDINPHDNLSYEESVAIIKQHVTDGFIIGRKEKLPQEIIDFIQTHHGKGKMKYFYNKWKNEHPDEEPDADFFSYPGPNPTTREQAILMMADSIEAASRSLKEYSGDSIRILVNNIIDAQINEGMYKHTPLTFRDLEIVKEVFIERLKTMYHARISYPEVKAKPKIINIIFPQ